MGFFDFFKSRSPEARVRIAFPENFEQMSTVAIEVEGRIPEGMEVWVWDLYYAKTLFNLGSCEASNGLKAELELWAERLTVTNTSGLKIAGESDIDPELILLRSAPAKSETYVIEVLSRPNSWPLIQTRLPSGGAQNRAAFSVLALAQYLAKNDQRASQEIPLHILGMRQYYKDVQPYTKVDAMLGAPTHAVNSTMAFLQKAQQSAARDGVEKRGA